MFCALSYLSGIRLWVLMPFLWPQAFIEICEGRSCGASFGTFMIKASFLMPFSSVNS